MNWTEHIAGFLKSEDISKIAKEDLPARIVTAVTGGPVEKVTAIKDTITDIAHLPTYIFWYKMERFLRGSFRDFESQVKLAGKFDESSNPKCYVSFVEDLIYTIDKIDNSDKIDYFSSLMRAFLLTEMEADLFWKLRNYIVNCTCGELQFVKEFDIVGKSELNTMISALYQYGLFTQTIIETNHETRYELSDFGRALKMNCLNFDDGMDNHNRLLKYSDLKPLEIAEAMTDSEVMEVLNPHVDDGALGFGRGTYEDKA